MVPEYPKKENVLPASVIGRQDSGIVSVGAGEEGDS